MQSNLGPQKQEPATILFFRPKRVQHRAFKIWVYADRGKSALKALLVSPTKDSDPRFSTLVHQICLYRHICGRTAQALRHNPDARSVVSDEEAQLLISVGMNPDPNR